MITRSPALVTSFGVFQSVGDGGSTNAWVVPGPDPQNYDTRRQRKEVRNPGGNDHEIEGYREALAEADLSERENVLVAGRNEPERARQVLMPVLASAGRPSALFAVTETMTIGALQTIWEAGLELPKDVSLLGFDDSEWFTALKPSVSTLRQPTDDFADQAWTMLMARLNNDHSPTQHSEVHAILVVRKSTTKCAADSRDEALSMPRASLATKSFSETEKHVQQASNV